MADRDKQIKVIITADGKDYAVEIDKASGKTRKLGNEAKNTNAKMNIWNRDILTLRNSLAVLGVGILTKDIINAGREMQRIDNQFLAVTGSSHLAGEEINFVRNESERLGLVFQSTAAAYAQVSAAAMGTNMEGQKTRDIFLAIVEAGRSLHLTESQVTGSLMAIQQMISKGTVQSQELRLQLGNNLPGAMQIAARSIGKTTAEFSKMLEQGQIVTDEFLPKFAAEVRKSFSGSLDSAIHSTDSEINRAKNSIFDLEVEVSANLLPAFTDLTRYMSTKVIPTWGYWLEKLGLAKRSINDLDLGFISKAIQESNDKLRELYLQMNESSRHGWMDSHTEYLQNKIKEEEDRLHELMKRKVELMHSMRPGNKPGPDDNKTSPAPDKRDIDAIKQLTSALQEQAQTFGMNNEQVALYKLQIAGATDAEMRLASLYVKEIENERLLAEAIKEKRKEAEEDKKQKEENQKSDEELIASLREEWKTLGMTSQQLAVYNNLHHLSADATDEQKAAVAELTKQIEDQRKKMQEVEEASKNQNKKMSEYSIQAARDMQSAWADLFFDPFDKGLGGMVDGFANALKRMGSELAASEVMKFLTGNYGSSGNMGGVLGDLFSWGKTLFNFAGSGIGTVSGSSSLAMPGAENLYAGVAHEGGIVGQLTAGRYVDSAIFYGAQRYHQGGEVPIIAKQGEEILTPSDPRHRRNGGGGDTYQISIDARGAEAGVEQRLRQEFQQMANDEIIPKAVKGATENTIKLLRRPRFAY